jgi:hypothetical protein
MSTQRIAVGTSNPDGSGPNFEFIEVPRDHRLSVSMPVGITCDLLWDRPHHSDETIAAELTNGTIFNGFKIEKGNEYYLANPRGTTKAFCVDFFGDV